MKNKILKKCIGIKLIIHKYTGFFSVWLLNLAIFKQCRIDQYFHIFSHHLTKKEDKMLCDYEEFNR